jgi:hypothetical protein
MYKRSSLKLQATSVPTFRYWWVGGPIIHKLFDSGPWIKFHGSWSVGLEQDVTIFGMLEMEGNLVW